MICWGDRKSCGIFVSDADERKNCKCNRDLCIADLPMESRRPHIVEDLEEVEDAVYLRRNEFINGLGNMLRIKSISNDAQYNLQNKHIIDRLMQHLKELHFDVEVVEVKPEDEKVNISTQYVLFANYFSTAVKNVLLIYGYVDVLPIDEPKKWKFEPFDLTEEKGILYGHGITTSKGPILAWIQAVDAWFTLTNDLPVNIRFVIEVNHYQNSRGLKELFSERTKFFQPVDLIIYCTNYWIAEKTPMIVSNHSGYVYFELDVSAAKETADKSSSSVPPDPMLEMCRLMNTLTDPKKGVLVENFERHVTPLTQNDWNILCKIESGPLELKDTQNIKRLPHEQSRTEYLKYRWCMPSISIHSVKTYHSDSLRTLRTPNHCVTRFSVKLVSQQSVRYIIHLFQAHLNEAYVKLKCVHNANLRVIDQLPPLNETRRNPFRDAVKNAFNRVYECKAVLPDNISITLPMLNELRKYCLNRAVSVGVPFASIHSEPNMPNESQTKDSYIRNINLCLNIMYEVSLLPPSCKCSLIPDYCSEKGNPTELDFKLLIENLPPSITTGVHELDEWEEKQKMFSVEAKQEKNKQREVYFRKRKAKKLD